jgi:hypothetical protein
MIFAVTTPEIPMPTGQPFKFSAMAIASVASDLNRFAICHLFTSLKKAGAHPA